MARKERKYHYIYKITCLKNNRYYIGIHSTDNLDDGYMGGGKRIKNSVKKHGKDAHKKEILEFFENRDLLVKKEIELVNENLLKDPMCMNIKLGGEGWCCTGIRIGGDGWKKANSLWNDPDYRKYMTEKIRNRINDPEVLKKISDSLIGNKFWLGKKHTEESKQKISESSKGKGSGNTNSQFGKIWIYNDLLKENKKISPCDYYLFENNWNKGLKMEYFKK